MLNELINSGPVNVMTKPELWLDTTVLWQKNLEALKNYEFMRIVSDYYFNGRRTKKRSRGESHPFLMRGSR